MSNPRILDLFCGAGGAAMGYSRAGFDVVGVDIDPMPHYPFEFIQADAIELLGDVDFLLSFDAIHASPPCQRYSAMTKRWGKEDEHPDFVPVVREVFGTLDTPWVIENVEGAPLVDPTTLCGSMFGLKVRRHRLFETSFPVVQPACEHKSQGRVVGVYGHPGGSSKRDGIKFGGVDTWREAMDIDWMTADELAEAIPPAYTEYIGRALLEVL